MGLAKSHNFSHEYLIRLFHSYCELELLICIHFPMGGNWNKQGGRVTLMWLVAFSTVILMWPCCT